MNSSRNPSLSQHQHHAPNTPSGLRASVTLARSPEDRVDQATASGRRTAPSSSEPSPNTYPTHLETDSDADEHSLDGQVRGENELGSKVASETTALLRKPFEFVVGTPAHTGPCNHGTFSPRLESRADSMRSGNSGYGFVGSPPRRTGSGEGSGGIFGNMFGSGRASKKMSTTSYLAERHGITNTRTMYVRLDFTWNPTFFVSSADICACQVPDLLCPIFRLDSTISMGTSAGRSYSCLDHGVFLSSYGSILRFESCPRPTDQWSILLRFQSPHICYTWKLSTDGSRTRGSW